jgi:hypothetical protein
MHIKNVVCQFYLSKIKDYLHINHQIELSFYFQNIKIHLLLLFIVYDKEHKLFILCCLCQFIIHWKKKINFNVSFNVNIAYHTNLT